MNLETIILFILLIIAIFYVLSTLIYKIISNKVGDCQIEWAEGYKKIEKVDFIKNSKVIINFGVPIKSIGKQQTILVDLFGRIHPEGDKYCFMDNSVKIYPGGNKRKDNYFEAVLIKPKDTLIIKGDITFSTKDISIKEALSKLQYLKLDLYYKYYCRNIMTYERKTIKMDLSPYIKEVSKNNKSKDFVTIDKGQKALPIKTPLLKADDNIYEIFDTYAKKHTKKGDIFAICESALAITEGRAYYVEDIHPGFLATHLNKFFKTDASLSSPYSMEMAIREVGAFKIITAAVLGVLGKIIGRAGDFYLFAGRAVATIDDCTGTLPPFDKYVVMGPKDPKKSANEFKEKTGFDMAVVDVNDLGKVDVLAITNPNLKEQVVKALKTNPQGNANQQTPIALIRKD